MSNVVQLLMLDGLTQKSIVCRYSTLNVARALRVIPAKIVIQPRVYVGSNFWKLPADNRIFQPKSSFLLSLSRFLCIFDFYDAIISDLRFCALPNPLAPIRRNGAFTAFLCFCFNPRRHSFSRPFPSRARDHQRHSRHGQQASRLRA